jgi:hypothetical protein
MKPSARRNFVDAAKEFEKIRGEAIASYPAAKRGRDRLELLAYLHALASEFRCALEALRESKLGERPTPTPPWLQADAPMAQLREYRKKVLDFGRVPAGASADDEETARQRTRLEHEPEPGCELVDACQDMAWFQDHYLLAETFAEAAGVTTLPLEDNENFIDETARAKMSEARQNRTLARMKDFAAGGDADSSNIDRRTKAVERARKRIDGWLEDSNEEYQAVAAAGLRTLAEHYPWVFPNDQEREHILAIVGDLEGPENRLRIKRWLTVQIVVDTAEEWAQEIRRDLLGGESVGDGDRNAFDQGEPGLPQAPLASPDVSGCSPHQLRESLAPNAPSRRGSMAGS